MWDQLLRLFLAGVLLLAGLAKAADRDGIFFTLRQFKFPEVLLPTVAVALPATEVAVGLGLLIPATAQFASTAALILFAVFTAMIGWAVARGRRFRCSCFGRVGSTSVGPGVLARNSLLTAVAAVVLIRSRTDGSSALAVVREGLDLVPADGAWRVSLVLGVLVVLETCALLVLLRRYGRLMTRLDDAGGHRGDRIPLRAGMTAPAFALPSLDGTICTLEALLTLARPTVLVFAAPSCGGCRLLVPEVVRWQREYADRLTVVVILTGAPQGAADDLYRPVDRVLLQPDAQLMDSYSIPGTPSALVVGTDGVVSSPIARGAPAIRALVGETGALR